jgi:hypothetical protein
MGDSNTQLLVPIKVEALVVDPSAHHGAVDRRWSSSGSNLTAVADKFSPTGPPLFMGAALDNAQQHWEPSECGVYVHWVLPNGMRHAHGHPHNELAFPPLPDQWLIVRFQRGGDEEFVPNDAPSRLQAWFVDASVLDSNDPNPAHVFWPVDDDSYLTARPVGRTVRFPDDYEGSSDKSRVTITALGSAHTGSPTFTAFTADNRNVLSFHDDLQDLRTDDEVRDGTVLSYLVLGWYRAEAASDEPLAYVRAQLANSPELKRGEKAAVLRALGWQVDTVTLPADAGEHRLTEAEEQAALDRAEADLPDDLFERRSLFHGMVAHINYFDPATYKGPFLGYPNAPLAHGGTRKSHSTIKVGIGANSADALIALVADLAGEKVSAETIDKDEDKAALWKALEAVVYRRTGSLLQGWKESPRQHAVHQAWFSPQDGGIKWNLVARERHAEMQVLPDDKVPTPGDIEHHTEWLAYLNNQQAVGNQKARELAALQQEFYGRWWLLLNHATTGVTAAIDQEQLLTILDEQKQQIQTLQGALDDHKTTVTDEANSLRESANDAGLELRQEATARFWQSSDPVIVVHNAGTLEKHAFPSPLHCRTAVNTGAVTATVGDKTLSHSPDGDEIAAIMNALPHFPGGATLAQLFYEAHKVEQALHFVATQSAATQTLDGEEKWTAWSDFLNHTLSGWDDDVLQQRKLRAGFPITALQVDTSDNNADLLPRLAQFWGHQPWSPLYLDWKVTWYPDDELGDDFMQRWQVEGDAADYRPRKKSAKDNGIELKGRSLMAPQMGRFFSDPIDELQALLAGKGESDHGIEAQAAAVLSSYAMSWQAPLQDLEKGGLLGQALSGFHQVLLGRELHAPRFMPNAKYPMMPPLIGADEHGDYSDQAVIDQALLNPPQLQTVDQSGKPLEPSKTITLAAQAPPALHAAAPFGLLQGGSLHVNALRVIDDFGQWCDLPVDATVGKSHNLVINPHLRWPDEAAEFRVVQPPRVLQPARLNLHFVDGIFDRESHGNPDSNPVCGWIFHNYLDHALTLCDAEGNLLGELMLVEEPAGMSVRWECHHRDGHVDAPMEDVIDNETLLAFASALLDTTPQTQQRLQALLALIDDALGTIRPATGDNRMRIAGRPLALVNARLGLELFGRSWRDPLSPEAATMTGSGDATLDALRLPVQLGHGETVEDGLIGYFKRNGPHESIERIMAVRQPSAFEDSTHYLGSADPAAEAVRVGFGTFDAETGVMSDSWRLLTLLMDPFGIVHAGAGILPVSSISLPKIYLERARENMELSFRVEPILIRPNATTNEDEQNPSLKLPVALPAGQRGRWRFVAPDGNERLDVLPPTHEPHYGPATLLAVEGRLALEKEEDA